MEENVIVHAYLTNGYLDWGHLYLQSFKYHNGEKHHIILDTRNLTQREIQSLTDIYHNITINNQHIDINDLSINTGIGSNRLYDMKESLEKIGADSTNRTWKMMIAGDDRIKAIRRLMYYMPDGTHIFHSDIDMYTRGNLKPFFKIIKQNDFTTRFRMAHKKNVKLNRKMLINIMGVTVNMYSKAFFDRWIYHIDNVPPAKRERGYGQTSCYYAYRDMKEMYKNMKWGDVHNDKLCGLAYDYPNGSKSNHLVWFANKKNKKPNITNCYNDFSRRR